MDYTFELDFLKSNYTFEVNFLKTIIVDFKKLLIFCKNGMFGEIHSQNVWTENISQAEELKLTTIGTMYYLYFKVFGEVASINPTPAQQRNINEVWIAMGYPENVINV